MGGPETRSSAAGILLLERTRGLIDRPSRAALVVAIGAVYAFVSMIVGGMLTLFNPPAEVSTYAVVLWSGSPWWLYPGLLVETPNFALELPFLPTIFMILTSIGVGLGMSVAVVLSARLLRRRKDGLGRPTAVGTAAGLTPAMIALITLGACCSTTAAAAAGIGITAQASGTTYDAVLQNSWYLGLFQVVILYVALLAQEQLVRVYGLIAPTDTSTSSRGARTAEIPPMDRRFAAGATLRVLLLAGGITWALSMFADWTLVSPGSASAGSWTAWILQNIFLGVFAVVAALYPLGLSRRFDRVHSHVSGRLLRIALGVAGFTLVGWMPPAFANAGLHGFVNELFGAIGLPASWGAVVPVGASGVGLALRWSVEFLLVGGFAIAIAVRPTRAWRPLLWATAKPAASVDGEAAVPPAIGAPNDSLLAGPSSRPVPAPPAGPRSPSEV